jgi:hypothetical protein
MTEYDYSPEAAERYKAKLRSIGKWVHETERHAPANPFMPSPAGPGLARLPASGSEESHSRGYGRQRSYSPPSSKDTSVQNHYQPQHYPAYSKPPASPPVIPTSRHYPQPQRSNTFPIPPPPPPPPPPPQRSSHAPKRSNTFGGSGSSNMQFVYDKRAGATRVFVRVYHYFFFLT